MELLVQFLGTVSILVLAVICIVLSRDKNERLLIISGKLVFKWLFAALVTIGITRLLIVFGILDSENSRHFNSIIFILAVAGITWSVYGRRR